MNNYAGRMNQLALMCIAVGLNIGIGALIKALNLPLYLDSIGTILSTLMLGWWRGAIVGVLGFIITSIFINPFAIYFCGTQVAIALFVHLMARLSFFSNLWKRSIYYIMLYVKIFNRTTLYNLHPFALANSKKRMTFYNNLNFIKSKWISR